MPRRGTEADGYAVFERSPRSISIFPGAQCSMGMGCRGFAPASFWLAYPAARANAKSSARRGHSLRHVQDSASWGDSSIVTHDQRVLEPFQQALYLIILLGKCCSCSSNHLAFESTQRGGDRGLHNTPYLDQIQCWCSDCGLKGPLYLPDEPAGGTGSSQETEEREDADTEKDGDERDTGRVPYA